MKRLFFAYGNLKNGFPQHHLLKDCKLLGVGLTVPEYEIYQVSHLAALGEGSLSVFGELYEIDDSRFGLLDCMHLVGGQSFFERKEIDLTEINLYHSPLYLSTWQGFHALQAWSYVFLRSSQGYSRRGDFWSLDFCSG